MAVVNPERLQFEILILDTLEESVIESELNLLYAILSNNTIWEDPELSVEELLIVDGKASLEVKAMNIDVESDESHYKAFWLRVKASYEWLEPKRKKILGFLKSQGFDHIHILLDQISEKIACQLYPSIYKIENSLRAYIVKFMVTRVGYQWWEDISTSELRQKVNKRKNNEKEFKDYIDNNTYLIDFGDLGKLIYAHSLGFKSKEDIIRKISELEETPEAIRKLKKDLQSNYQKFFKELFKDRNFQAKWEDLEKVRHKVAHNSLFIHSELKRAEKLSRELLDIIEKASLRIDEATLSSEEREAIKESVIGAIQISESEALKERTVAAIKAGGTVALKEYMRNPLALAMVAAIGGFLDE